MQFFTPLVAVFGLMFITPVVDGVHIFVSGASWRSQHREVIIKAATQPIVLAKEEMPQSVTIFGLSKTAAMIVAAILLAIVILAIVAMTRRGGEETIINRRRRPPP